MKKPIKYSKNSVNKNILLVFPGKMEHEITSLNLMPLSLLYLAGALRSICEKIQIFDVNLYEKGTETRRLDEIISECNPSIIGINCLAAGIFPDVMALSRHIKEKNAAVKIITGGAHPTMFAREIMANCPYIDAVVLGEGEYAAQKLLRYYYDEINAEELDSVCLRINDKIVYYKKSAYIENMDDMPFPGYEFFDFNKYSADARNWLNPKKIDLYGVMMPLLTSRSCPNMCNFCAMNQVMGKRFRARSAESVFDEIAYLHNTYGINYFTILDDNFTFDKPRVKKLCNMIIDSGMQLYFDNMAGLMISTLDRELIELMAKAGFMRVGIAVESGNDYIRNEVMRKNVSREKIIEAVDLCRENGLLVTAFFLIGMPEETEESLRDTYEMIKELNCAGVWLSHLIPFPGTKVYEQCQRDGLFVFDNEQETLWNGEYHKRKSVVSKVVLSLEAVARDYHIKPYDMTLEKLAEWDGKIQTLINIKTRDWKERNIKKRAASSLPV